MTEFQIDRYLRDFSADSVLDVGPGYTDYGRRAARVTGATRVTYLDIDPDVLAFQCKESSKEGLGVDAVCTSLSIQALAPLDRVGYDVVICTEVLEHLQDAEEMLAALARLLTRNGRIILTVPTRFSERWLKLLNPGYMKDEPYGHVREFDEKTLRRAIDSAGLEPIVFHANNPHYFVSQSWLIGMRVPIKGATGSVARRDWRVTVFRRLTGYSFKLFTLLGYQAYLFWARLLPRNYFVMARKKCARRAQGVKTPIPNKERTLVKPQRWRC